MMREERLDFVDIVTTMPSHKPLVLLAARHKLPTIVQKPFAPTWQECVDMVEACAAAGVPLMVHENFRFQSPMLEVRRVLASGAIGEPTWGRITWRTGYDIYAGQPYLAREKRFILLDIGVHVLDLARVLMGEVERVYCETQSVRPGIAGEDTATITLRHRSGAVSLVDCSYAAKRDPDPFPEVLLEIEGRRGSLILSPGLELKVTSDGADGDALAQDAAAGLDDGALARGAGERAQHPAALGRVPEGGPRAGDLGSRTISRPTRWRRPLTRARQHIERCRRWCSCTFGLPVAGLRPRGRKVAQQSHIEGIALVVR